MDTMGWVLESPGRPMKTLGECEGLALLGLWIQLRRIRTRREESQELQAEIKVSHVLPHKMQEENVRI
jgi:hypothetical protein